MSNYSYRYTRRRKHPFLLKLLLAVVIIAALAVFLLLSQGSFSSKTPSASADGLSEKPQKEEIMQEDDSTLLIVLDPGHGGYDPGALSASEEILEKDITLAITLYVRELLEDQEGISTLMTREDDSHVYLSERAELANSSGADLFVSIHANALENSTTWTGIYTYYHPDKSSNSTLAQTVQDAIIAATGAVDRGANTADYYVLRETTMPAILIETGFLSSPEELALLTDSAYQQKIAQGIVDGLLEYIGVA